MYKVKRIIFIYFNNFFAYHSTPVQNSILFVISLVLNNILRLMIDIFPFSQLIVHYVLDMINDTKNISKKIFLPTINLM